MAIKLEKIEQDLGGELGARYRVSGTSVEVQSTGKSVKAWMRRYIAYDMAAGQKIAVCSSMSELRARLEKLTAI